MQNYPFLSSLSSLRLAALLALSVVTVGCDLDLSPQFDLQAPPLVGAETDTYAIGSRLRFDFAEDAETDGEITLGPDAVVRLEARDETGFTVEIIGEGDATIAYRAGGRTSSRDVSGAQATSLTLYPAVYALARTLDQPAAGIVSGDEVDARFVVIARAGAEIIRAARLPITADAGLVAEVHDADEYALSAAVAGTYDISLTAGTLTVTQAITAVDEADATQILLVDGEPTEDGDLRQAIVAASSDGLALLGLSISITADRDVLDADPTDLDERVDVELGYGLIQYALDPAANESALTLRAGDLERTVNLRIAAQSLSGCSAAPSGAMYWPLGLVVAVAALRRRRWV